MKKNKSWDGNPATEPIISISCHSFKHSEEIELKAFKKGITNSYIKNEFKKIFIDADIFDLKIRTESKYKSIVFYIDCSSSLTAWASKTSVTRSWACALRSPSRSFTASRASSKS